jgi:hypothetical protein
MGVMFNFWRKKKAPSNTEETPTNTPNNYLARETEQGTNDDFRDIFGNPSGYYVAYSVSSTSCDIDPYYLWKKSNRCKYCQCIHGGKTLFCEQCGAPL